MTPTKVAKNKLNRKTASAILEYLAMEDCKIKESITILSGALIKKHLKYVNASAKKQGISQEEALQQIIHDSNL